MVSVSNCERSSIVRRTPGSRGATCPGNLLPLTLLFPAPPIAEPSQSIAQSERSGHSEVNGPEHPSQKRERSPFRQRCFSFPSPFSWHCFGLNSCARHTAGALLRAQLVTVVPARAPFGFRHPRNNFKTSRETSSKKLIPVPPIKHALGLGAAASRYLVPKRTGQKKEITRYYDFQSTHSHRLPRPGC